MKSTVKIKIVPSEVEAIPEESFTICGRLLGICNNMQASKILRNEEVASKIFTSETVSISDLNTAMTEEYIESKSFGRPVMTVSSIENALDNNDAYQNDRKNLFILSEVMLLSESTGSRLTMECKDGSTAIMEVCNE